MHELVFHHKHWQYRKEPSSSFVCYNVAKKKKKQKIWVKEYTRDVDLLLRIVRQLYSRSHCVKEGKRAKTGRQLADWAKIVRCEQSIGDNFEELWVGPNQTPLERPTNHQFDL